MTQPDSGPAQMPLTFPVRPRYGRDVFFVSPSNRAAIDLVDRWPQWPSQAAAIYAPSGAGKTHLLHIWAERTQGAVIEGRAFGPAQTVSLAEGFSVAVDDADIAAAGISGAQALFHLLNRAIQEGGSVLLSGTGHPALWPTPLPDLRTRLGAVTAVQIEQPDDTLMAAVLTKLFADHQLSAPPGLVAYVVARIERSFDAATKLARAMDLETIGTGRLPSYGLAERLIAADTHD